MNWPLAFWRWLSQPDEPAQSAAPAGERVFGFPPAAWLAILCSIVVPIFVLLMAPAPVLQSREIDPGVYAGLATDYAQLTERFGATYYATRVSYIVPAALLSSLFGSELGYMVLRGLLLILLSSSVFFMVRAWFGTATAVFMSVVASVGPWLLRELLWDYTDGIALTYLLAAFCLALDRRGSVWTALGAGAFFALAVNSGSLSLAIGGAFLFSWAIMLPFRPWRLARRLFLISAGFIATYAVMSVAVYLSFPVMGPFFETINIVQGSRLLAGGSSAWFAPLPDILDDGNYYVLAPLLTLLMLGAILASGPRDGAAPEMRRLQLAAFVYLAIVCSGLAFMHFVLRMSTLATPWGISYAFPAVLIGWTALVAPSLSGLSPRARTITVSVLVALVLGFFVTAQFWLPGLVFVWDSLDLELAALLAIVLGVAALRPARPFALAAFVLLCAHSPYRVENAFFARMHMPENRAIELDARNGGAALLRLAGRYAPPEEGRLVIWHPTPAPRAYMPITSFLFWGYSLLDPQGGGLPNLTEDDETEVRNAGFLVLMAPTASQIDAGLEALQAEGIGYQLLTRDAWRGRVMAYQYAILDIENAVDAATDATPLHVYSAGELERGFSGGLDQDSGLRTVTRPTAMLLP
ncbi:MAG: hypothetical protein AB7T59_19405 [Hyphomonadaceae bacterium]